jgi:ABC-type nitrate/sulfonate/bicarbonate transport system substrate-binding protein
MNPLKIGGVPEHFNLPWQRVLASGELRDAGIAATWEEYPGGTGAMRDALDDGRLDVAMLLTEGAVAAIANGADFRIVSVYTETPLIWGVHVPAASLFESIDDARGGVFAISRFGSGSHLMAFALSQQRGWPFGELRFAAVGDLEGAVSAFERGDAEVFLWEKFMTKPLVDAGRFRRVGEFEAPWPAFVVAASNAAAETRRDEIVATLARVFTAAERFRTDPGAAREISARFGLAPDDATAWLRRTRWASEMRLDAAAFARAAALLHEADLIPAGFDRSAAWSDVPGSRA